MSERSRWIVGLVALAAGIGVGAAEFKVVESHDVATFWVMQAGHEQRPPRYPAGPVSERVQACVEIGFSIGSDGVPAQLQALRSSFSAGASVESTQALTQAATDAVAATRYEAAPANPERIAIYTHSVFTFVLSDTRDSKAVRENRQRRLRHSCEIENFTEFVHGRLARSSGS